MAAGSEIAVRYVTVYARMAPGMSREINSTISQGVAQSGKTVSAQSSKAVASGLESGVKQAAPRIGATFKSVMGPILTLSAVAAVTGFVRKAVDAFSDLEDATGAAGVVFGDSMDKIIAKGETAAAKLGMSKAQIIDAANTFGTLGKSARLSGDDLADFSNEMTDVAGSLSSFKGGSPEEAILAVGAALRGESEPIRRYGILLDDATLRQRALTLGITDNIKTALTPQQRVLAAQAEILAQSGDAMGDFERTANSTANVQKTLAAESANLSAEIGEKLAPAIVTAQKAGIGMLRWATDNQALLVPLVGTVGALTAAIGGFVAVSKGIEAVKSARETIRGLGDAFQGMSTKAKIATASAGAVGLAITAAALIYGNFAQRNADAEAAVASFTEALKEDTGALGENTRAAIVNQLNADGTAAAAMKMGITVDAVADAILGNADALDFVNGKMGEYQQANAALSNRNTGLVSEVSKVGDAMGATAGQIGQAQAAYEDYQRAAGPAETETRKVASAVTEGKLAYEDYTKAINGSYNAQLKLAGSERAAEAAIDEGAERIKEWTAELANKYEAEIKAEAAAKKRKISDEEAAKQAEKRAKSEVDAAIKSGAALDITTEAGRKNEEALHGIADTTLSAVAGMTDLEKANGTAAKRADTGREAFIKLARSFGKGKEDAEALADKMGLLKSKEIDFTVNVKWKNPTVRLSSTGPTLKAGGGAIRGPGTGTSDSILMAASNGEWVIKEKSARYYGPALMDAINQGRIPREALAGKFATGGPVGTWKGHSLDYWEDYLLTDLESTRLQIRIDDLKASLTERETYYTGKGKKRKKKTRLKLRDLERTEAQLELKEAQEQLAMAKDAAKATKTKVGAWTGSQMKVYSEAADLWQQAASSLSKSAGISLDPTLVRRTNAIGDVWTERRDQTAADLARQVGEQATQVETFIGLLDQLRKAGASEALISDVMDLGTIEGTKAARMYLADRASMAIANANYARLTAGASQLSAIGDLAGKAAINVTINEAATPEATKQAVVNGILAGRS